jgi:hypothetical protein
VELVDYEPTAESGSVAAARRLICLRLAHCGGAVNLEGFSDREPILKGSALAQPGQRQMAALENVAVLNCVELVQLSGQDGGNGGEVHHHAASPTLETSSESSPWRASSSSGHPGTGFPFGAMGGLTGHEERALHGQNLIRPRSGSLTVSLAAMPNRARKQSTSDPTWRMMTVALGSAPAAIRTRQVSSNGWRDPRTSTKVVPSTRNYAILGE